jgi:hypothetical protein
MAYGTSTDIGTQCPHVFQLLPDATRIQKIIVIKEPHELAARMAQADIPRDIAVTLRNIDEPDPLMYECARVSRSSVADDKDLYACSWQHRQGAPHRVLKHPRTQTQRRDNHCQYGATVTRHLRDSSRTAGASLKR